MTSQEREALLAVLELRFGKNMRRHPSVAWSDVQSRLLAHPDKLRCVGEMDKSGGEPDVIGGAEKGAGFVFCDCSAETPSGRRSLCYDRAGLESRKEHKPQDNAIDMAAAMGISLLTEDQYRELQRLGEFDQKTSSWVLTPPAIRKLGGALFCDRRYGTVFTYHNGAQSYYAARAFRGWVAV